MLWLLCSCTPDVYNRARTAEKLDENTNCCRVLSLKPLTQVRLQFQLGAAVTAAPCNRCSPAVIKRLSLASAHADGADSVV